RLIGGQVLMPLAWVYLAQQPAGPGVSGMCSMGGPQQTPLPADASRTWAVVMDATSAVGYVYQGTGAGFCRGSVPTLWPGNWTMSIPYTDTRLGPLSYRQTFRVPACGTFSSWMGGRPSAALATVPTGACHGTPTTRVDTGRGRIIEQPHAKPGLWCWETFDQLYGKPLDCAD
ncbi:MAG: hypothetical protein ACHQE5_05740, partial [Actinomycetes bacterium]